MVVKKYSLYVPFDTSRYMLIKLIVSFIVSMGLVCLIRIWLDTNRPESPKTVSTQNDDIYFSLLKDLSDKAGPDENLIVSMLGGLTTFYAAYLGAAGETQEELEQFVFDESTEFAKILSTYTLDLKTIPNKMDNPSTDLVVGVFIQNESLIRSEYIKSLQESFVKVNIENVDFRGEAATSTINKFVSGATAGQIPHLYDSELDSSTQIVLLPAFYATTTWKYGLDASKTKPGQFFTGKKHVAVSMMNDRNTVAYFDNPALKFEAIFLLLQDDFSSVLSIVLPYKTQTLANLTHQMSTKNLLDAFSGSTQIEVDYTIPRMKFSSAKPLKSVFQQEGVKTIFGNPDFSRMASNKLKVCKIYQAIEIAVNENGVNISAAIALQFSKSSKPISESVSIHTTQNVPDLKDSSKSIPKSPKEFFVDRPFLLTINGLFVDTVQSMVYQPNGDSD